MFHLPPLPRHEVIKDRRARPFAQAALVVVVVLLAASSLSGAAVAVTGTQRSTLVAPLSWVRNLQRDLHTLHFYSGPTSGVYSAATRAAVVRFQTAVGLVTDGEWGLKSQAALDKKLGRKPSPKSKPPGPLGWVRNLQHDLHTLHFYSGTFNGVYNAATRAAVVRFQTAAHLVADGEWGVKSQAALDRLLHRKG